MKREYQRWYSASLHRDMELLAFGHAGARVIVFPTSMGRFFQWEDPGLVGALGEHLERGGCKCSASTAWTPRAGTPNGGPRLTASRATSNTISICCTKWCPSRKSERQSLPDHRRGELRRLSRRQLCAASPGSGQPHDRHERRSITSGASPTATPTTTSISITPSTYIANEQDPERFDSSAASGYHPRHRARRYLACPATSSSQASSGARASAMRCASGTAGRTIGPGGEI